MPHATVDQGFHRQRAPNHVFAFHHLEQRPAICTNPVPPHSHSRHLLRTIYPRCARTRVCHEGFVLLPWPRQELVRSNPSRNVGHHLTITSDVAARDHHQNDSLGVGFITACMSRVLAFSCIRYVIFSAAAGVFVKTGVWKHDDVALVTFREFCTRTIFTWIIESRKHMICFSCVHRG